MAVLNHTDPQWQSCKRILCIRPDNIGDLLMSTPAIRALKQSFGCHITVLTSSMAAPVVPYIPEIDDCLVFDAPWVKSDEAAGAEAFDDMVRQLRQGSYDAAVIFTVYSQNPLPTAMLPYLAGIPLRLAYCRENPYRLLTHWVPDKEPYELVRHQVQRDLSLVAHVGAYTNNEQLSLRAGDEYWPILAKLLRKNGVDPRQPWIVLHAGVSENKREYPPSRWIAAGRRLVRELGCQLLLTGTAAEAPLVDRICSGIGKGACSLAGQLPLPLFIALISKSMLVISVNTGTVHMAAATGTPVVVLYALTNPQHTPWSTRSSVLYFDVPPYLRSRNEVIRYAYGLFNKERLPVADTEQILRSAQLLLGKNEPV